MNANQAFFIEGEQHIRAITNRMLTDRRHFSVVHATDDTARIETNHAPLSDALRTLIGKAGSIK